MKVAEIMQRKVESVSPQSTVRDVSRLIFGRGINGVPVCKGKKIVGFVTERDILKNFYPSMEEYMEDPVHARDFENMEKQVIDILEMPVEKIMTGNPTTIASDTPLLKAQSMMFAQKIGRLPVVDKRNNLIGILSKGDIFRAIVGRQMPFEEEEGYFDVLAREYDVVMDWKKRLASEIPDLVGVLKKERIMKVLDVASSTGEHAMALAKNGFEVYGIDRSSEMYRISEQKKKKLPKEIQKRLHFFTGKYQKLVKKLPKDIQAVIFMGSAASHVLWTDKNLLHRLADHLQKPQILVFQIANFEKNVRESKGFRDFNIRKPHSNHTHSYIRFFTEGKGKSSLLTRVTLDLRGNHWVFRQIASTPVLFIKNDEFMEILKRMGYTTVTVFGGQQNEAMFQEPFDPSKHYWFNIVATR